MDLNFAEWKMQALIEYLRLSPDKDESVARMYFDHVNTELYNMYRDGTPPLQAVKELMFDDEHE